MEIAILGWGSLIWRPEPLRIRTPFQLGGPRLTVEFSHISDGERLTLVIDDLNGDPVDTYFTLSSLVDLPSAVEDLRAREGRRVRTEEIGIARPDGVDRSQSPAAGEAVRAWTAERDFDATIWTDLVSNFEEIKHVPYTVEAAVEHLDGLVGQQLIRARRYVMRAPVETDTKLRRRLRELGWLAGRDLRGPAGSREAT